MNLQIVCVFVIKIVSITSTISDKHSNKAVLDFFFKTKEVSHHARVANVFGVSSRYFRCWLKRIRSFYIIFFFKKMCIRKILTATYQIWSKWVHFQAKERPGILKVCLFLQQYWYVLLSILKKVIEVTGKSKTQENINNCRICWIQNLLEKNKLNTRWIRTH